MKAVSTTGDRLSWLFGGYADAIDIEFSGGGGVYAIAPGDPRVVNLPGFMLTSAKSLEERSWSIFGEVGYEIVDGLTLKLAGRYSNVEKTLVHHELNSELGIYDPVNNVTFTIPGSTVFPPILINNDQRTFKDFQPAVTLEYRPTPGMLFFASYKEGFKAGGFDTDTFFLNSKGNTQFEDETVKAWEAGAKIDFLNGRARFNITAFRADYDDLQVNIFNGFGSETGNAPGARSQGINWRRNSYPFAVWFCPVR